MGGYERRVYSERYHDCGEAGPRHAEFAVKVRPLDRHQQSLNDNQKDPARENASMHDEEVRKRRLRVLDPRFQVERRGESHEDRDRREERDAGKEPAVEARITER